jgi:hypothetical protein
VLVNTVEKGADEDRDKSEDEVHCKLGIVDLVIWHILLPMVRSNYNCYVRIA